MSAKTRALVTGATGFIGGRLAAILVSSGWNIKLLVRTPAKLPVPLRQITAVITGDLSDENQLRHAVRDVDVIFHCAANVNTWDTVENYHQANVIGVGNLLRAIATENLGLSRLVHVSTVDVYGYPESPCDETCETRTSGFGYGDSKRLGEKLVQDFCNSNHIPYTIIRPANVIGPGSQFIQRIGQELISGLMLNVDSGRANSGLVYIDNLVAYMLWAAESEKALGQCYNARDSYDVSWAEVLVALRNGLRGRGVIINLPFRLADALAWTTESFYRVFLPRHEPLLHRLLVRLFGRTCGHSSAKLQQHSGLHGMVGFEEALSHSIQWYQTKNSL
jgi:nucleoside-diphosphate-sugar epimerase